MEKGVPDWSTDGEIFRNEFAMVRVSRVETPTGSRLHITDLGSGREILLDPLELEGLTVALHSLFAPLLDPSDRTAEGEPDPDQV